MTNGLYVPIYASIKRHPKFKNFCKILNLVSSREKSYALGCLVNLWTWAIEYYQEGRLIGVTAGDLAEESWWDGDPKEFVSSLLEFPTNGNPKTWRLTEMKFHEYQESYPFMDILAECKKALQWLRDNPAKRKTARGMPKFLGGWLSRANDTGKYQRSTGTPPPPEPCKTKEQVRIEHDEKEIKERIRLVQIALDEEKPERIEEIMRNRDDPRTGNPLQIQNPERLKGWEEMQRLIHSANNSEAQRHAGQETLSFGNLLKV